jgi:hypothetical protein
MRIKILKGLERLLRIHVFIKQSLDLEERINIWAILIESLVFKHHKLTFEFSAIRGFQTLDH